MSNQSIVRLHAKASVNPNDWETFKQMVSATKIIVAKEGPEAVLLHECYYDLETFECLIIEGYADEAAFLSHLELIKPLSSKYQVDWKIERLELLGPYSENVVAAMRAGNEHAFSHYSASLNI
ncbi:hypothetical protein FEM33_20325 [Dyadobacter flavalbus]|uniref:ABM domain-containing protein n=1 Tax=Dyadobacter flavalbus TaxID=2579942 RepID=A0A5M8QLP4_9BACT|nr:hypothetical protein [Dyadobacter flavalbus]KAA6437065.1 hypothetical protein FEM33_20325 [Dyadobacter flavalbus]